LDRLGFSMSTWLALAAVTLLAAIGFAVLALMVQWQMFARKAGGGTKDQEESPYL
jgi:putative Ca2+/H+ antiporter (TMEM165/GDT1 family)